jgi:hypothetical protein
MPDDNRLTRGPIHEVLDVLERHGYRPGDSVHTAQAIGLIGDVAGIYEGTLDAPRGGYAAAPSSQPTAPQASRQPAVIVPAAQAKPLLAAPDEVAEYKRYRAGACSCCTGRSCTTCQWRLQIAGASDQLAEQMTQAAETAAIRHRVPGQGARHRRAEPGRRAGGRTVTWHRTAQPRADPASDGR